MKAVVRVATSNNFNCTRSEWDQLNTFHLNNSNKYFFINSNIHTPALMTVNDHPYKVVITANPGLTVTQSGINWILDRLQRIRGHIAFIRVKYIPRTPIIRHLLSHLIQKNYPVVITLQRWNSLNSLMKFCNPADYTHSCSRYRLHGAALQRITRLVNRLAGRHPVWICDRRGLGCQGCGLCSRLTTGQNLPITSLNLSTSGECPYNCPDCYAKTMVNFAKKCGHNPIAFDKIKRNRKQAGLTAHIQHARVALR